MHIDLKVTKKVVAQCVSFLFIGIVVRSAGMVAGGLISLVLAVPVSFIIDHWRHKNATSSSYLLLPSPQLLLPPPE